MKREGIKASDSVSEAPLFDEKGTLKGPALRYITKALTLLHDRPGQEPVERRKREWGDLYTSVKPFSSALELSDNVKEVVRSYVADRLPALKGKVPSVEEFSDEDLLAMLVKNELSETIPGGEKERRGVLIGIMAHVVKRIETTCYRKILEHASAKQLETLGLDERLRDIVVELLEASLKADPLFVRFLAYSQLSGEVPENARPTSLHLPNDRRKRYTLAELFPHETGYLSAHLSKISASNSEALKGYPGGGVFEKYLTALGAFYGARGTREARVLHEKVEALHREIVDGEFPIVVTPPAGSYYKEPYTDPELVVSLTTKDAGQEEKDFCRAREAYATILGTLDLDEFSAALAAEPIRSVVVLGSYGVDTVFKAVAQQNPIVMYYDEQVRAFDREFPDFLTMIVSNSSDVFGAGESDRLLQERMSRTNTILHELSHTPLATKDRNGNDTEAAKRLGHGAETIIDEVKAEILYHALIPEILAAGGLAGTKEQWAVATLGSTLQGLRDNQPGDEYYYNATYILNDLMEKGVVVFDGKQATITDYDQYYEVLKDAAREVISLYTDTNINEKKALSWIKERCRSNTHVKSLEDFLKKAA